METMSPQDASFLLTGDAVTHMSIGSVGIFDGVPPAPDEVPAAVARQLPLVPRYRQKVRFVPLDLGRLIWAGDPHFTLGYHARRTALPSPAGGPERRLAQAPPPSSLNGPIGPHRGWDWARGQLADVKEIRAAQGRTVNDVVLAAISGGFRELLIARGEAIEDRVVRTLVPVSVRAGHERETYINKVSGMIADRPVSIGDPVARLNAIREQMQKLKRSGEAVATGRLVALGGFTPAMLLALAGRTGSRTPQRALQTVTANIPAPRHSPYLCGRRMLEESLFVPLGSSMRVGVAIFSYDGTINFGVTGDRESAPDVGVLCRGIEHGRAALRSVASPTSTPKRPVRATPKPAGREQRSCALRPRVADMSSGEGQDAASVAESSAAYVYAGLRANGDYYYSVTIPSLIVAAYGGGNGLATQRECLEMVGCYVAGKVRKFAGILAAAVLCGVLSLGSAIVAEEWMQAHDLYGRDRP